MLCITHNIIAVKILNIQKMLISTNTLRGGRRYNVPAYGSVYPSYGYSAYGRQYNGGYFPRFYGTYRPAAYGNAYTTRYQRY